MTGATMFMSGLLFVITHPEEANGDDELDFASKLADALSPELAEELDSFGLGESASVDQVRKSLKVTTFKKNICDDKSDWFK